MRLLRKSQQVPRLDSIVRVERQAVKCPIVSCEVKCPIVSSYDIVANCLVAFCFASLMSSVSALALQKQRPYIFCTWWIASRPERSGAMAAFNCVVFMSDLVPC